MCPHLVLTFSSLISLFTHLFRLRGLLFSDRWRHLDVYSRQDTGKSTLKVLSEFVRRQGCLRTLTGMAWFILIVYQAFLLAAAR